MTYVEYKQLNPFQRFAYNTKKFSVTFLMPLPIFYSTRQGNS